VEITRRLGVRSPNIFMAYHDLNPARRAARDHAVQALAHFEGVKMYMERDAATLDASYGLADLESP
jgi:hypothetical protein